MVQSDLDLSNVEDRRGDDRSVDPAEEYRLRMRRRRAVGLVMLIASGWLILWGVHRVLDEREAKRLPGPWDVAGGESRQAYIARLVNYYAPRRG